MQEVHLVTLVVHAMTREPLAVLGDDEEDRCLVVSVRPPQAEVMAHGPHPARDDDSRLTQDLVADVATALGHQLAGAEITDLVEDRFRAVLVLADGTRVAARPSDALAIAVRDALPIGVADEVMERAGQSWKELQGEDPHPQSKEVDEMRDFLDQVTADDFGPPGPGSEPPETGQDR
ncbi:bifunctional nuclease family protein [Actinomycetospora sp.]|uniref:bifunctional nuclease family protein n=1 Tax=Actinomycetospora sp. TaxID=1872135 RepID=UPI002F405C37